MLITKTSKKSFSRTLSFTGWFVRPGWLGWPDTLSRRLVMWNVLVLAATLLVLSVLVHQLTTRRLLTELDNGLRFNAYQLQLYSHNFTTPGQLLQATPGGDAAGGPGLFNNADDYSINLTIYNKETGQPAVPLSDLTPGSRPSPAEFAQSLQGQTVLETHNVNGVDIRTLVFPLKDNNGTVQAVGQLRQSLHSIERVSMVLIVILGLAGIFGLILAYSAGCWLTRREVLPLQVLTAVMGRIKEPDCKDEIGQLERASSAEIRSLRDSFEKMLARLAESYAQQRSFVTQVSHELRTPVTAVRGQLDVILLNPALDPEVRGDLEQVNYELQRLSRMVGNILMNARQEAGGQPALAKAAYRPVELDLLLIEVARQMQYLQGNKVLEIAGLEQVMINGDADQLKQVLLNIVDNALTYTPPDGKVSLELSQSRPGLANLSAESPEEEGWAVFKIKDNGAGIDPSDQPYLFERYYRARQSGPKAQPGTGLGLYIARMIVQAHGGQIQVESQPGQGCCFSVRLPLAATG